ncbi:AAA family ATPase [Erythrobacter sp. GH1-10]|uniref:phosphotransferase-like protein n=1 Tax=Erythrobacter sp. GH1-10 TaxID=3349334 RepID=UPI003877BADD
MAGSLIVLNGVSSAGKTTLAHAIQTISGDVWLHVALDSFIAMLPDQREIEQDWFPVVNVKVDGKTLPRISTGHSGGLLLGEMRGFARGLVASGLNVVVDDVCEAAEIADYRRISGSKPILLVCVTAPTNELEQREDARGDRLHGLAREQNSRLHKGIEYDLIVDTSILDPIDAANRILEALPVRN